MKSIVKNFGQFVNENDHMDNRRSMEDQVSIEIGLGQTAAEIAEYLMTISDVAPDCVLMDISQDEMSASLDFHGPANQVAALVDMVKGVTGYSDEEAEMHFSPMRSKYSQR